MKLTIQKYYNVIGQILA